MCHHTIPPSQEQRLADEERIRKEKERDYLAPFLARIGDPAQLSAAEKDTVRAQCLEDLRTRLVEVANIIQIHFEKVNTPSLLSPSHHYHTITTITPSLLSLLSHHHYYHHHITITPITPSLLSPSHHYHSYHTITTITITLQETEELQQKQVWYKQNQQSLTREKEAEYISYCSAAMFRIHILEHRLNRLACWH